MLDEQTCEISYFTALTEGFTNQGQWNKHIALKYRYNIFHTLCYITASCIITAISASRASRLAWSNVQGQCRQCSFLLGPHEHRVTTQMEMITKLSLGMLFEVARPLLSARLYLKRWINRHHTTQKVARVSNCRILVDLRWTGNVARMRQIRNVYKIIVRNLNGRDMLRNLGLDGRIILKYMLNRVGTRVILFKTGSTGRGSWDHGNKHLDPIKGKECLNHLSDYGLFNENFSM
jgi:hypothetical protein